MSDFVNKDYNLRIQDVIAQLWGYKRLFYFPVANTNKTANSQYTNLQPIDSKFDYQKSVLGTPIIMPLKIQISAKGEPVEYWQFPNEPIVELKSSKKIIETDIDDKQGGTFKELYNLGDYSITIRGVAVDDKESDDYPEDLVRKLRRVNESKTHLEVVHPLFTLFNIKYISIYDFDLPSIEGAPGMAPYEFMAKSDREFDLELKHLNKSTAFL